MRKLKQLQFFINRHYGGIKIILLTVLTILVVMSISQTAHGVADIINSIQRENEKQTKIINQQLRALCIIVVETSGQEGLKQLDPPTKERCENLSKELAKQKQNNTSQQRLTPPAQVSTQPITPQPDSPSPAAGTSTSHQSEKEGQPHPSDNGAGLLPAVVDGATGTVKALTNFRGRCHEL